MPLYSSNEYPSLHWLSAARGGNPNHELTFSCQFFKRSHSQGYNADEGHSILGRTTSTAPDVVYFGPVYLGQ